MGSERDYFAVLGVGLNATQDEIRSAYRRKAKDLHPDANSNADPDDRARAEEGFKRLEEAYYVLSDENRRRTYIRTLPPFLLFDPPLIDFGDICSGGTSKRVTVRLRNIGGFLRVEKFSQPSNGRFWSVYSSAPSEEEREADPNLLYNFFFESEVAPDLEPNQYGRVVHCFFGDDVAELYIKANILPEITDTTTAANKKQPGEMLDPTVESLQALKEELDLVPISVARLLHLGALIRRSVIQNEDGDWLHVDDEQFVNAHGAVVVQGGINSTVRDLISRTDPSHWLLDAEAQAECEELLAAKLLSADHTSPKREAEKQKAARRYKRIYEEPIGEGLREYEKIVDIKQPDETYFRYAVIDWSAVEETVVRQFTSGLAPAATELLKEAFRFIESDDDRKAIFRAIMNGHSMEAEKGLRVLINRSIGGVRPDRSFRKRWRAWFKEPWSDVLPQSLVNAMKKFDATRAGIWRDNVARGEPSRIRVSTWQRQKAEASGMRTLASEKLSALARANLHDELLRTIRMSANDSPLLATLKTASYRPFFPDQEPVAFSHLEYLRSQSQPSGYAYLDILCALEKNESVHYALEVESQKWFEREGWFTRVSLEGWRTLEIDPHKTGEANDSENYRRYWRFDGARMGLIAAGSERMRAIKQSILVDSTIRETTPDWFVRLLIDSGRLKPRPARGES